MKKEVVTLAVLLTYSCTHSMTTNATYFSNSTRPLVLAHRGASGPFPEHTVGSYSSAYHYGADFVELDLQLTKDGHLVLSHDPCLRETTDIDSWEFLFGSRKQDYVFMPYFATYRQDYLINNFTLAELKMLRRKARYT